MSVLYHDVQMEEKKTARNYYKSSEIDAVTIKTEYHHLINLQTYGLF